MARVPAVCRQSKAARDPAEGRSVVATWGIGMAPRCKGYRYWLSTRGTAAMTDADYDQLLVNIGTVHGVEPYNWAEVSVVSGNNLIELLGELSNTRVRISAAANRRA